MWIGIEGNPACSRAISDFELSIVDRRSMSVRAERPCSSSARADASASVPAPPVRMAQPSTLKRADARAAGDVVDESGGSGAVSGLSTVERLIVGMLRFASDARSSTPSEGLGAAGAEVASPIVTNFLWKCLDIGFKSCCLVRYVKCCGCWC